MPSWGAVVGAAPLGVLACGAALDGAGEPLWPALPVGVIGAGLAAVVARDVASGAARRQQGQIRRRRAGLGGVTAIVVLAALIVAAVSLVLEPFSLLVLAALLWLVDLAPPPRPAQTRRPPRPALDASLDDPSPEHSLSHAARSWSSSTSTRCAPTCSLRAIDEDGAPTFAALLERGVLVPDCVSSFPSVTPVASSEMVTGVGADRHWISGMNWYHRLERRYVEYGSSLEATRAFGLFRALYDLVYNMNLAHLSPEVETLFERLDDAGDPHRLHPLPDLPRPPPPPGLASRA